MNLDIRWKQRLDNYSKALGQLTRFIEKGKLNELEQQGLEIVADKVKNNGKRAVRYKLC